MQKDISTESWICFLATNSVEQQILCKIGCCWFGLFQRRPGYMGDPFLERSIRAQHSTSWCPGTAGSTASQDKRIVRRQVDVVIIKSHSTIQLSTTDSVALSPTGTKLLGLLQSPFASGVSFIKENSDVTNHGGSLSTSRLPGSVPWDDQFLPTIQPVLVSYERVARVPSQESCDVQLNPLGHTPINTHSLTVQIDVIALVIHNPLDRHQFGHESQKKGEVQLINLTWAVTHISWPN
ncbi:hypothetical protein PGT21_028717 [Puccinia graminis f. sp. tritici]|uniref:Uncharacterized protein n=1 Tax=Puccinia graminis f. sp. tritici TaxID=56615 RepID=A0A5B0PBX8_PUCGR|nr:hypothetical protein PGT21_028717 [Puccinia graminis f. sp. tritici]